MIRDGQVRELFRLLTIGKPLALAARKTDMDEKTARKYRRLGQLPSQCAGARWWRTRPDPFVAVWPQIEQRLQAEPALRAVTLFRWLQGQAAGEFSDSQRRTFERKVRLWRAMQGPRQEVMFAQVHHPGDLAASDFTHMDSLRVTLGGRPFPHLAYHFTLTYSNWESVTLCQSESFEAFSEGLQNALWKLGGVPRRHRSDSLSAAVNNLSEQREFHQRYRELLEHYDLAGERTNVRQPHENGDAESSHRHFKDAVDQPSNPSDAYTCVFDAWNRLVAVTDATLTVAYSYDGTGRLVETSVSSAMTYSYYVGQNAVETRLNGTDASDVQYQYVYSPQGTGKTPNLPDSS